MPGFLINCQFLSVAICSMYSQEQKLLDITIERVDNYDLCGPVTRTIFESCFNFAS